MQSLRGVTCIGEWCAGTSTPTLSLVALQQQEELPAQTRWSGVWLQLDKRAMDEQTVVAEQSGEIVVDSEKSVVSSVVEASDAPAVVNDAPTDVPAAPAEHPQPEAAIEKIASETGVVEDESRAPGTEKTIGAAEADSTLPADTVEVASGTEVITTQPQPTFKEQLDGLIQFAFTAIFILL